jgi:hypothetical protein
MNVVSAEKILKKPMWLSLRAENGDTFFTPAMSVPKELATALYIGATDVEMFGSKNPPTAN